VSLEEIRVRRDSKGGDRPVSIKLDNKRTTALQLSRHYTESLRTLGEEGLQSQRLLWDSDLPTKTTTATATATTTTTTTTTTTDGSTITRLEDHFAKLNNVRIEFRGTDGRHSIEKSDSDDYMDLIDY
jgi:microcystin-dependent protein